MTVRKVDSTKRCLNWGWYGFENYGDDLLQKTMISLVGKRRISMVFPMKSVYSSINYDQIPCTYTQLIKQVNTCDALMIGPGGLFPFANPAKLFFFLGTVVLWKYRNKKICFLGIGISAEVDWLSKRMWQVIIKCSDLFFTRSDGFLKACGIEQSDTIKEIPDIAFASEMANYLKTTSRYNIKHTIGIAVANICGNSDILYKQTVEIWKNVCSFLLDEGYSIDLIGFTKKKDDKLINDIYNSLKIPIEQADRLNIINYERIEEAINSWGNYEFTICNRFHSLVLSVIFNVPSLPIAYGTKTACLAQNASLDKYLLYWNQSDSRYLGRFASIDENDVIEKIRIIQKERKEIISLLQPISKDFTLSALKACETTLDFIEKN